MLSTVISHVLFTLFMYASYLSHEKLHKLMPIVFYHGPVPGMFLLAACLTRKATGEPLLRMPR